MTTRQPPRIITGRRVYSRHVARTGSSSGPGWRRRPGRPRHSWIQQIGAGTPFSIRAEWSKARRRGHSGLTQRTSAVYAIWWWWFFVPLSTTAVNDRHASHRSTGGIHQKRSLASRSTWTMDYHVWETGTRCWRLITSSIQTSNQSPNSKKRCRWSWTACLRNWSTRLLKASHYDWRHAQI